MKDINGIEIKEGDNVRAWLTYPKSFARLGIYRCTGTVIMDNGRLKVNDNGNLTRIDKFRSRSLMRDGGIEVINKTE